ncbi:low molecular weight protein-tyrosine-phosphatase [Helicobacter trogontum]|uniref:protein-tyrosine-phosphatase n=1 Tax=Helicobacter trogontum TaxID=50960 RepID=A0ABQ0D294_9HELI|nr:low molecular weight protein-tyrosine-phosphatase [Helicobacter trogontum]MCI5787404.1 low molecular weight phosphotyrosine protein phosphatase [Helicobacter trogontum]MDY5186057.1 low molecular weight protein-tyrosine-phosphatase [Helicobacter trogontum]
MKIQSVLFVCLGNICRSPLAEGIAKNLSEKFNWNLKIDSCGISSFHRGEPPHIQSIRIAKANNIDISMQKSRPISVYGDMEFDLIVAMDSQNKRDIISLGFPKEKVIKLGDFDNGVDVPDPYYCDSDDGFREVYNLIEALLEKMFDHYGFCKK